MKNNKNVPEMRFEGFTETWEQRKLGEVADKVTEKNVGLQYIETFTNSAEFGIISQRDFFDHDIAKMSSLSGYYIVRSEDFAYNPRISTSAPVGPINRNKLGRIGVMSPLYTVFRPYDIDTTYLEHFFKSRHWHSFMNFNGDSGARSDRFSIKDSLFFEMPIPIPHIKEQRKIGVYLDELDHLITLHQCKYEKLLDLKKSMMYKLFPKEGETTPEIRFDGFSGDWEKKKLGDCFSERTESFPDGELLSVTINQGIKKFSELNRKNNSNDNKTKYKKVYIGDIAYNSMRMWQGASGYSPFEGIVSPAYTVLNPNEGIDSKCFSYLFKRTDIIHMFQIYSKGITSDNWNLKYPDFKELEVYVSRDYQEQKAIGEYFSKIDTLIELNREKLEKLKNIKSSLLDKMFV